MAQETYHVLGFVAENFKKLRIVEITPKGRMVQITGRNGQGKTSVLDALWAGLAGKRAIPEKPVRKGAAKGKVTFKLGDIKTGQKTIVGERTIEGDRTTSIKLTNADGTKYSGPQGMLDDLFGELAMDPLEFINLDPAAQITALRQMAKVEYDFEAAAAANQADFDARTTVNRDIKRLEAEVASYVVQPDLPKEKLDETELMSALTNLGQSNLEARRLDNAKAALEDAHRAQQRNVDQLAQAVSDKQEYIASLERQLAEARLMLVEVEKAHANAKEAQERALAAWQAAPSGDFKDAAALTQQLQQAQTTNREIDKRIARDAKAAELETKRKEAATLTRQIERRDEAKAAAIGSAKLPVDGLAFDEKAVLVHGIPLEQLGEAEQIRISALIAMAANPKLRVLRILHGEALDDDNLAMLAQLAEEHNFQMWVARVDSSGKVGIVMEDGEVKADMSEAS